MNNVLIVIENKKINLYALDEREMWKVGRPHKDNVPDIQLTDHSVSRKHGVFQCIDGYWFYIDNNKKNGTVCNGKHIEAGYGGRIKPVMLKDGDTFVFGCNTDASINQTTSWAIYLSQGYDAGCRVADTSGVNTVVLTDGEETESISNPKTGTVVKHSQGMAIYMGDITYLLGSMRIATA